MVAAQSTQSLLPHDKEAEQGVLGAVIHDNESVHAALEMLTAEMFFSPAHQYIFQAMTDLDERNEPIDEITLGNLLRAKNQLGQVGGLVYVAELVDLTPVASNVLYYAGIVREKHQLRSLIGAATEIASKGRESPDDVEGLIHNAEDIFLQLADQATTRTYAHINTFKSTVLLV